MQEEICVTFNSANLAQNIDITVAGIFDETMLTLRACDALELMQVPICCAVSIYHPLAQKKKLTAEDLYGQKFMLMKRNWSKYVDQLRDDLWKEYRSEVIRSGTLFLKDLLGIF